VCLLILAPRELPSRPQPKCCFLLAPNKLSVARQRSLAPASAAGWGVLPSNRSAWRSRGRRETLRCCLRVVGQANNQCYLDGARSASERKGIKFWAVTPLGSKTSGVGSQQGAKVLRAALLGLIRDSATKLAWSRVVRDQASNVPPRWARDAGRVRAALTMVIVAAPAPQWWPQPHPR